ncbi:MAG: hypothetical protein MK538_04575 [Planctomycetes bacterium]|nr:hypothetical protein [Planctomycetota bacterium]
MICRVIDEPLASSLSEKKLTRSSERSILLLGLIVSLAVILTQATSSTSKLTLLPRPRLRLDATRAFAVAAGIVGVAQKRILRQLEKFQPSATMK